MLHKIFTVYDQKAEAYLPPFFLPQTGMAVRTFSDCVNNPEHQFGAHPSDYTLSEIGTWDESDGSISVYKMAKSLGTGVEYKITEKPEPG